MKRCAWTRSSSDYRSYPTVSHIFSPPFILIWTSALFTDFLQHTCSLSVRPSLPHILTHSMSLLKVWQNWGLYTSISRSLKLNRKPLIFAILPHRLRPHIWLLTLSQRSYWFRNTFTLFYRADFVTSLWCLSPLTPSAFKFCTIWWFDFSSNTDTWEWGGTTKGKDSQQNSHFKAVLCVKEETSRSQDNYLDISRPPFLTFNSESLTHELLSNKGHFPILLF